MVPPVVRDGDHRRLVKFAPLTSWHTVKSFDSEQDCRTDLVKSQNYFATTEHGDLAKQWAAALGLKFDPDALRARLAVALCVATDDPRLKEK
jgi:hypothetical protein